jgi:hypothetical protein
MESRPDAQFRLCVTAPDPTHVEPPLLNREHVYHLDHRVLALFRPEPAERRDRFASTRFIEFAMSLRVEA